MQTREFFWLQCNKMPFALPRNAENWGGLKIGRVPLQGGWEEKGGEGPRRLYGWRLDTAVIDDQALRVHRDPAQAEMAWEASARR